MAIERFTVKAQEALAAAQGLAEKHSHQQVEPEHLLLALLQQKEGVVAPVLQKIGVQVPALEARAADAVERLTRVSGDIAQTWVSGALKKVMNRAIEEAEGLKDDYASGEHLLLAL